MKNILVIDDLPENIFILQDRLVQEGYEVKTALNGKDAMEIVQKQNLDIVITDLIMPEIDGVELCRQIKAISPKTEVVLLSGHPEAIKKQRDFISAGGRKDVLRKPLSMDEIVGAVDLILKEKE